MVSTRVGNLRFWSGIRSGLTFDPPEEDPYIPRIGTAPPGILDSSLIRQII